MALQQLGSRSGHLREMRSMQKEVQLTTCTFCVMSKEKYINVVSFKNCYSIIM